MRSFKKVIFFLSGVLLVGVLGFGIFLGTAQILEYRPRPVLELEPRRLAGGAMEKPPAVLSLFTWNLGYGGLDAGADFILEGGSQSRARGREVVEENMAGILDVLKRNRSDIYFLQEVDINSHRSFGMDEVEAVEQAFPAYGSLFAVNFKAFFVPTPLCSPLGRVHSGQLSLSRFPVSGAQRLQLPGEFAWPVRLFHLKRCLQVMRFPSPEKDRDWVLINLHLSAYDPGGNLRRQQLNFIMDYIRKTSGLGHFVVLGGDWNSLFPGTTKESFAPYTTSEENLFWVQPLPEDFHLPGWRWAFAPRVATCRSLEQPYRQGENFRCIVDGFLVSPDVEVIRIEGMDLGFGHSDHNPLRIQVRIRSF